MKRERKQQGMRLMIMATQTMSCSELGAEGGGRVALRSSTYRDVVNGISNSGPRTKEAG